MIIHRRGHNFQSVGAISILNEVEECNKIHNSINKYLNILNVKQLYSIYKNEKDDMFAFKRTYRLLFH